MRTTCLLFFVFIASVATADPPTLKFIENKGQWPGSTIFGADVPGGNFYLTPQGFSYLFYNTEDVYNRHHGFHLGENEKVNVGSWSEDLNPDLLNLHLFHADFVGGDLAKAKGVHQLNTNFNYYFGNNPDQWVSKAAGFYNLEIEDVYENIDLKITSSSAAIKYDILVGPEADVSQVQINYRGADAIYLRGRDLIIKTSVNEIREYRPYAYQMINGKKTEVPCEYRLEGTLLSYEFPIGYDECYELVIDPLLIFSTYSGSAADNWGNTATFGERGKLYSGGITNHFRNGEFLGEFPATEGAFQTSWGGVWDLAIIKYDSAGSNVEYATYLGGSGSEVPISMIMNNQEELLIYGVTNSTDFPTTSGSYQTSFNGGTLISTILGTDFDNGSDTFIVKLSPDGSALRGSTYFGGSANDGLLTRSGALTRNYGDEQRGEIFIDDDDNVLVAGTTSSRDLFDDMSVPSFDRDAKGGTDAFVIQMSTSLNSLNWGGYIGGSNDETGFGIKIDINDNVFVAGGSNSPGLSFTNQLESYHGNIDGWVARINTDTLAINAGSFIGTSSYDQVYFLDLDSKQDVYLLGQTTGNFPIKGNVYSNVGGGQFIQKMTNGLDSTIFSTAFGTEGRRIPNISPTAFLVNDCNNLYVAGWGNSQGNFNGFNYLDINTNGLPTTSDAFRTTTNGDDFYLMVLDANATSLLYGTFYGGDSALVHVDGGTSRFDKSGIVYHSVCASCAGGSTFPTTAGAWSNSNGAQSGCNNAAFKFDLASLRAIIQTNNTMLSQPGFNTVCLPDSIVFENLSIGGVEFHWNFGDGNAVTKTDTSYIAYQYSAPGEYIVTLRAVDPNTCIAQDITSTVVYMLDPMQEAGDDAEICQGESFELTARGGTSYSWTSADSTFMSEEISPLVMPAESTKYYVLISDANCSTLDSLMVDVIPEVDFNFSVEKVHDCFSRPKLKLENNNQTQSFTWDLGDGTVTEELNLLYDYAKDGVYLVRLIGENGKCVFQREFSLNMVTIKVPNVFTPSDGAPNDRFEIISASRENLKIFNRWGRKVYENTDYQDDWTGEDVPAGVYFYEAAIEDETTCTGWVQVIR